MKKPQKPAIIEAVAQGDIAKVSKLLSGGLLKQFCYYSHLTKQAVVMVDEHGNTALFFAARLGYVAILELLIQAKAEVNHSNHSGFTPLHSAAQNGNVTTAKILIEHKANVNSTPCDNSALEDYTQRKTPLFLAASRPEKQGGPAVEMVKLLLTAKADPTTHPEEHVAPIHFFAQSLPRYQAIVKQLLLAGGKLDLGKSVVVNPLAQSRDEIYFAARYQMTLFKYKSTVPILGGYGLPEPVSSMVVEYATSYAESKAYVDDDYHFCQL